MLLSRLPFSKNAKFLIEKKFLKIFRMRQVLARRALSHNNRIGFAGYGHKIHADEVVPADQRAFRDLKLYEVSFLDLKISKNFEPNFKN